jgi:hypothetical protein
MGLKTVTWLALLRHWVIHLLEHPMVRLRRCTTRWHDYLRTMTIPPPATAPATPQTGQSVARTTTPLDGQSALRPNNVRAYAQIIERFDELSAYMTHHRLAVIHTKAYGYWAPIQVYCIHVLLFFIPDFPSRPTLLLSNFFDQGSGL